MPESVAVVTDSTAHLPPRLVSEHRITVVPLQVVIAGRSLADGVEVTSAQLAAALSARQPVTTSRPSPQAFVETYRHLAARGASGIVSVHLSAELSGTVDAARTAAAQLALDGITVEVVDSRLVAMGLGFAALAAARAAADGEGPVAVARAAAQQARCTRVWFYVDTLEYLRRGGRIGPAAAWVGSALAVKPLLYLVDGRLAPLERVRTSGRAMARLEEIVLAETGPSPIDVAVHHLASPQRANELADRIRDQLPGIRQFVLSEVGAVLGAHVGPGMIGVVLALPRS